MLWKKETVEWSKGDQECWGGCSIRAMVRLDVIVEREIAKT